MSTAVIGGVYYVADHLLKLPPDDGREIHQERRPFVVLSGAGTTTDPRWPTVLGCPVSSSTSFRTRFDVKLAAGEANVIKKCWIRVPALQPLDKKHLQDQLGVLGADKLHVIHARIAQYLGMIAADEDGNEEGL